MKTLEQLRAEAQAAKAAWANGDYPDTVEGDLLALERLKESNRAALAYRRALREASK